ncbi:porin family protein [Jejudonia soesokkakensis]|uniref:Porin family protein n=1 Tax=Jejudonia soesokkakensis TaxID=1323432 RepID=A0ABW2MX80_9FLAO
MKKLFLCSTIALFSVIVTNAQEFHFGAKAGLNFASARGDDAEDLETRTSFNFGGVLHIPFDEKLGFQAELLYSGQGYSIEDENNGDLNPNTQTIVLERANTNQIGRVAAASNDGVILGYINIPLLVDYKIIDALSIQAGPEIAFNVSSKADFGGNEVDLKDQTSGTSFSALLGTQYKLPMGVFFQARYALGLNNIPKDDAFEAKNAVFSISAGYFFN